MLQFKTKLLYNKKIKARYFHCALDAGIKGALPGQFINVKVRDDHAPLLRRPFSIHGSKKHLELLYEVIGEGSRILSRKKPGEFLDVIGPLGNGFDYPKIRGQKPAVLVAGGMGVAPLFFLAERLKENRGQKSKAKDRNVIVIGAKDKDRILCERGFKQLGFEVYIATDDGSRGFKGTATGLLENLLHQGTGRYSEIYACGPRLMLREISRISETHGINAQVSLEEHMACGFGVCLGCVVNTVDGYQRVCKEGPVFNAREIIW